MHSKGVYSYVTTLCSNSRAESLVLSSQLGELGGGGDVEISENLFREHPVSLNFSFPTVGPLVFVQLGN